MRSTINEVNTTELDEIMLPYGHTIGLKEIEYENGMRILRATIRENRRFTTLDFDPDRATDLATALMNWAKTAKSTNAE